MKTLNLPAVGNMNSPSGNPIPNQFIITTDEGTMFQSYRTIIAHVDYSNRITLDTNATRYSRTTTKYLAVFLGIDSKTLHRNIKDGKYFIENLNNS